MNGMSRKIRIIATATVAASVLALTACSSDSADTNNNEAGGATAWALTGGAEEAFKASFEEFNAVHPDSKISVEWFANDAFKEKIQTSVNTSASPTLIQGWGGGTLKEYVDAGLVVDLTDQTKDLQDKVFESVLASGMVDGKLYGAPNNQTQPAMIFYNKELFAEKGLAAPDTWENFIAAIDAFKDTDVTPVSVAGQSQWPYLMWIQYLTDGIGGPEVFNKIAAGEADAWSDPAITQALTTIQELVDMGAFGNGYASVAADAGGDTALVHTGKAAMVLQGAWVFSDFLSSAPDFVSSSNLGYSMFPTVEGGKGDPSDLTGNTTNYWSVSSKNSESAQNTAIQYLNEANFSDEHIDALLKIGAVPPVKGLEEKVKTVDNSDYVSFVYDAAKNADHFQLSWDQALPSAKAQALLTNLSEIFNKTITPEQFVTNMNAVN